MITWHSTGQAPAELSNVTYIRAEALSKPAVLIVESVLFHGSATDILSKLRFKHWKGGPLRSVMHFSPIETAGYLFARTAFEIVNPRKSTVAAAAGIQTSEEGLVLQLVLPGVDFGHEGLDQLFREAIDKALEIAS